MNLIRLIRGFLLSFIFLIGFVYAVYGVQWVVDNYPQQSVASVSVPAKVITQTVATTKVNAKSAISVETNLQDVNKIIVEQNENTQLPIASLTKLMTAVVVLDNPKLYDLSKDMFVDTPADSQDAVKQDVKLGDVMPEENFLEIMLVESSNKSAYALAEVVGVQKFVGLMNKKAKDLGLKNTFFIDPTGLGDGNVSTASDLANLAEYILANYPRIADISRAREFYVPGFGKVSNTDQLLGEVPDIVCSKTGFTAAANGCLLLIINNTKNNDYLINVILGADDRFAEMKNLINLSSATCK